MNCPKCENVSLAAHSYKSFRRLGYICNRCGGVLIAFEDVPFFPADSEPQAADERAGAKNDRSTGLCPNGHGIMVRAKVDLDPPFYLEKCNVCGYIWFDGGEWKKLAEHHFQEYILDFWDITWQRKQQEKKAEKTETEWYREKLGTEFYDELIAFSDKLNEHPAKEIALALFQNKLINRK